MRDLVGFPVHFMLILTCDISRKEVINFFVRGFRRSRHYFVLKLKTRRQIRKKKTTNDSGVLFVLVFLSVDLTTYVIEDSVVHSFDWAICERLYMSKQVLRPLVLAQVMIHNGRDKVLNVIFLTHRTTVTWMHKDFVSNANWLKTRIGLFF